MAEPVWDIVRRESSYLRKFNGIELSAEPSNLLAKNSFKYSGLAQTGSLGVTVQTVKGKGDKIKALATKSAKGVSPRDCDQLDARPHPRWRVTVINLTHGRTRAGKAINAVCMN